MYRIAFIYRSQSGVKRIYCSSRIENGFDFVLLQLEQKFPSYQRALMHRDPSGYAFSKDLAIWFLKRCAYVLFNRHFCWKQNFPPTEINWSKKISRFERERVNHHRSGKIKNLICRLGFDADFLKSYSIVKYRKLRDAYRLFKRRIKTFRDLTRQHEGYKNVRRRPNTLEGWTVLLILFFLFIFFITNTCNWTNARCKTK